MEKSNINPNSTETSNVSHSNSYRAADSSSITDVFSFAEKSRTKVLLGVGLLFSFLNGRIKIFKKSRMKNNQKLH